MAASFAGMTALLAITAIVIGSPVAFLVALPLGVTAYFMYYHGSGKLLERMYQRRLRTQQRRQRQRGRQTGGFGAGPRSRGRARTRHERDARYGQYGWEGTTRGDPRDRAPSTSSGPSMREARSVLGVDAAADQDSIKQAYRERVKETHPDRGGDETEFKRITAAYDVLRE